MQTFDQTANHLYVLRIISRLINVINVVIFGRQKGIAGTQVKRVGCVC